MIDKITYQAVAQTNWKDFEALFESKGDPDNCWCMPWRLNKDELSQNTSSNRI